MSPRAEHELAMDGAASHAVHQPRTNLLDTLNALSTAHLQIEAKALLARMLSSTYQTRDFAIVAALIDRVQLLSMKLPDEHMGRAAVLRFEGVERRVS